MMAVEGPFLAAVIARLVDPTFNLAAHGVAYAFALLVEAPVIMIMSASTALAEDAHSFRRLRTFTYVLNAAVTAAMLALLVPSVFRYVMLDLIAIPDDVADLTYVALWLLLPWPGAIGYRRFYQGLLIRGGRTRLVAYGTVLRLTTMATTALVLYFTIAPPGAWVGAAALAAGVSAEAVASRIMARTTVHRLLGSESDAGQALSYSKIVRFYYPLALTSLIGLAVQPMVTFFMGRALAPLESLAVFPVVVALSFIFRAMGLSFQEVAIALMGNRYEHVHSLWRFALTLGIVASAVLALVALTPLSRVWYETVSGLAPELARFAILPTIIIIPIPLLSVILSFQRAILMVGHTTRPVTWATAIEVGGIALLFPLLGWKLGVVGVTAATIAFMVGRLAGNLYLVRPCVGEVKAG